MLGFLVAGLLIGQQDEVRDWEFRASRWENLVSDFSRELGTRVRVDSSIKDEVVVARVAGKDKDGVIQAVSEGTLTKWSLEEGVWIVRPDGAKRGERRREIEKIKEANLQAALDKVIGLNVTEETVSRHIVDFVTAAENESQTPEQTIQYLQMQPGAQVAARLVGSVGTKFLTAMKPGERIVYSPQPTVLQRALGSMTQSALKESERQRGYWVKALGQPYSPEVSRNLELVSNDLRWGRMNEGPVGEVWLGVSAARQGYSVDVHAMNMRGEILFNGGLMVSPWGDPYSQFFSAPAPEEGVSARVELKPIDKVIRDLYHVDPSWNLPTTKKLSSANCKADLEVLAQLNEQDPQSGCVSDLVFEWSKATGKDVIGTLPDVTPGLYDLAEKDKVSLHSFLDLLGRKFPKELVVEGDSQIRLDFEPEFAFINRESISRLAQAGIERRLNLDTLVLAKREARSAETFDAEFIGIERLVQGADVRPNLIVDRTGARVLDFVGSLTGAQRATAFQGTARILVRDLSVTARAALADLLFNQRVSMPGDVIPEFIPWRGGGEVQAELEQKFGAKLAEPTFYLALPEISPLSVGVSVTTDDQMGWSQTESIPKVFASVTDFERGLAQFESVAEIKKSFEGNWMVVQPMTFLDVEVTDGEMFSQKYTFYWANDEISAPVKYDDLPERIRRRLERRGSLN